MTEQQIPLPFRKPARLSAAQRKAMIQAKLQDYPVYQAAREAKRKHHVIEQFKNEQLSLYGVPTVTAQNRTLSVVSRTP